VVTSNDYELELYNGDQGLVLFAVSPSGLQRKQVVFPARAGQWRAIPSHRLESKIELGYAQTIHRSQGPQFNVTALLVENVCSRELLYTGITRTSRGVVIREAPAS